MSAATSGVPMPLQVASVLHARLPQWQGTTMMIDVQHGVWAWDSVLLTFPDRERMARAAANDARMAASENQRGQEA